MRRCPLPVAGPRAITIGGKACSGRFSMQDTLRPDPHAEIKEEVRKLCAKFPGEYWRQAGPGTRLPDGVRDGADRSRLPRRADPGGIRRRRPAAVGRGGDPGDGAGRGLQRRGLPRADVHHGHDPAARHRRAEDGIPAEDRHRRTAAAGVRRDRADQRHRHDLAAHLRPEGGRPLCRQRPEGVDQPRGALRPDAAAGAHHAARPDRRSGPRGCRRSSSTCGRCWARA